MAVQRSSLVLVLSALFAGMTALLLIGAVVSGQFVAAFVAIPIGATSYFMYYHGSGKLARAVYRGHEARRRRAERAGPGAGPRSRGGPRTRAGREARAAASGVGSRRRRRRTRDPGVRPPGSTGPTRADARKVLGVGVTADDAEIKRAYREKVKDVHPDRGGDEEEFKRVTAAYDRLTE